MRSVQRLNRVKLQQDRRTLAYERKYARVVRNALREQVEYASRNNGVVPDQPMYDALTDLYNTVSYDFLQFQYRVLDSRLKTKKIGLFLNPWREWITTYVFTKLAHNVAQINDTTRKKIQEAIAIGVDQGLQWDKIARLIRDKASDIASAYRAVMIARTETANAANMAKDKSKDDWKQETGETIYKLWVHRFAKEPRSWHQSLDNNRGIPEDQAFEVVNPETGTIEYMMRPHSDGASAENVVNCSCQVMYVSARFARSLT